MNDVHLHLPLSSRSFPGVIGRWQRFQLTDAPEQAKYRTGGWSPTALLSGGGSIQHEPSPYSDAHRNRHKSRNLLEPSLHTTGNNDRHIVST